MATITIEQFPDGFVILADSAAPETYNKVRSLFDIEKPFPLIIADPPYGNIVSKSWDKQWNKQQDMVDWMLYWSSIWRQMLVDNGAFYIWGGIGKVNFRPFFQFIIEAEEKNEFELANLITWKKKRGYGVQNNYLFTREELAYFIKGNSKKPYIFNKPYLEEIRGYPGYNKKYPAKDARYRRSNVWTDITEILKNKLHINQKAPDLYKVIIETHTNAGDWVLDPFAGCGTLAVVARDLGRRFVIIENDKEEYSKIVERLKDAG